MSRKNISLIVCAFFALTMTVFAQEVSTMGSVGRAQYSVSGFQIVPAWDLSGYREAGDLAPVLVYELVHPHQKNVTLGRLNTSCSCIELRTVKRQWQSGERILLELHNIRPTPAEGWNYSIFIQVTSPIRAVLRYDLFLKSDYGDGDSPVELRPVEPMLDAGPGRPPIPQPQPTAPAEKPATEKTDAKSETEAPTTSLGTDGKADQTESKYAVHDNAQKEDKEPENKTESESQSKYALPTQDPEEKKDPAADNENNDGAGETILDKPSEWI